MKIALVISSWAMPRPVNLATMFDDTRGLTGSEISILSYARGFEKLGHDVTVFGNFVGNRWQNIEFKPEEVLASLRFDMCIAWIDPRPLQYVDGFKVLNQQVNDFSYCQGWENYINVITSPAETHKTYLSTHHSNFPKDKWIIAPNGVDTSVYNLKPAVSNHKMVYASSPDRGLHWVLESFPDIKKHVPDAELHVYYNWKDFYESCKNSETETGYRLRYCNEMFGRLKGVFHYGSISKNQLLKAMSESRILTYPCDPVSFTEGFSVTTMEAAALGCLPVIVGADALTEIYGKDLPVISPPYKEHKKEYIEQVVRMLTNKEDYSEARYDAAQLSKKFNWNSLAMFLMHKLIDLRAK